MVLASSWYDPVIGVDIHIVLVPTPAGPVPTPIPMPFVGMVYDPVGAVVGAGLSMALSGSPGLAMVNCMLATNCGTEVTNLMTCPHIPAPGPFAAPPGNDAELYFGSLNVSMAGTLGVRLGDMALSCSDPVRLPTSLVLAIPKGMPVLNLPAMVPDLMAICMAAFFKFLGAGFRRFRAFQRTSEGWAALSGWIRRHSSDLLPEGVASRINRMVCAVTGHPVDVATGRMFTESVDFELPGPLPLKFERVYDTSLSWRETSLGWGWSHSLDEAVWYGRGRVFYKSADGRQIEFHTLDLPERAIRPGQTLSEPYGEFTLRCVEPYRFEVETHAGVVHEFARLPGDPSERMRLTKRRTRDGHTNEFHYDRAGRLEYAVDSGGRIVRFEHNDRGQLTAVKLPLSKEHGWYPSRRFEYDERGDLVAVLDSHNKAWRFEYASHLMVQETDRAGLSFYFQYDGHSAYSKCVRTWGDGGIYDHEITYDPAKRKTIVRDSVGAVTVYEMDDTNAVIAITDAHGGRESYERCPNTGKVLKETNALGEVVEKAYDERGNLVRLTGPDGATTAIEYHDRMNIPTEARDALGRCWRWIYDGLGHLTARQNPAQETTMYEWTDTGLLESVQSPGERVTRLAYDERKNVAAITLPNGARVEHEHDGQGRVVRTRDALGAITRVERCSEGWTRAVHLPMGVEQQLGYDDEGNLLEARDPNRHVRFAYGHYHRLVARDEGGTRLRFEYDTEDRLTAVLNEAGERYEFELDACGRVKAETGFDGFKREYVRDAEGRVKKTLLPSGRQTELSYDAAGRMATVSHSDGTRTEFGYDLAGQLLSARNESADVRFERDALGRILSESQDGGATWVRSGYEAGQRMHVESDFGALQRIAHDALGKVSQLANGAGPGAAQVAFARNALGMEVERQLPGGVHVGWTRDVAGRPLERHTWRGERFAGGPEGGLNESLEARSYQWRGADQIAAIINPSTGPTFYDHDDRGRLVRERRPGQGRAVERSMDAVGNVYRSADGHDRRYGPGGRLLEADGIHYEHDDDGNQVRRELPDGSAWAYAWNGAGMLSEVTRPDGERVRFEYDAFARRTAKRLVQVGEDGTETVQAEHRFVWDRHTVLHELDSEHGMTTWYWEPNTFTPVAKEQNGRKWTVASDHLGTPTEMYDELGQLAWKMQLDVFGVAEFEAGGAQDCPWRWPGQYEDAETGDYYNRYRYYGDGAYRSRDPSGTRGGFRTASYVSDTVKGTDPLGLVATYGPTDTQGRATGAFADLTQADLRPSGSSTPSVDPSGWIAGESGVHPMHQQRSHLIADTLGGTGADSANLVTLDAGSNHPGMSTHEGTIRRHLQADPNARVLLEVTPHFDGDALVPSHVHMYAIDVNGNVLVDAVVPNGLKQKWKCCV